MVRRDNRKGCDRFKPNNGGIVLSIEFDKRILNELRDLAEEDGLGSIYQEIRNACYSYVENRRVKPDESAGSRKGIVGRIESIFNP